MGMISPGQENFSESFSTLKFAHRTKKIKNKPKINEKLDQETLILKYENELKRLRRLMSEKSKGMGQSKLIQLEQAKQRANKDKYLMMLKLQEQSQQFLEEREEKKRLMIKIKHYENQVVIYQKLKEEFNTDKSNSKDTNKLWTDQTSEGGLQTRKKMEWMESQLGLLEKEKAHVDQYKDLLFRQKDIMVALTSKLNKRDESIVQLQEELETYDKVYLECEGMLSYKNNQLEFLEQHLKSKGISVKSILKQFDKYGSQIDNVVVNDAPKESKRISDRYADVNVKEDVMQNNLKDLIFNDFQQHPKSSNSENPLVNNQGWFIYF